MYQPPGNSFSESSVAGDQPKPDLLAAAMSLRRKLREPHLGMGASSLARCGVVPIGVWMKDPFGSSLRVWEAPRIEFGARFRPDAERESFSAYNGAMTCKSAAACPVCAPKIADHRAVVLTPQYAKYLDPVGYFEAREQAREAEGEDYEPDIGEHIVPAEPHVAFLVTLTFAHHRLDCLDCLIARQGRAWEGMTRRIEKRLARKKLARCEYTRGYDATHGKIHGWHSHYHMTLLVPVSHNIEVTPQEQVDHLRQVAELEAAIAATEAKIARAHPRLDLEAARGRLARQVENLELVRELAVGWSVERTAQLYVRSWMDAARAEGMETAEVGQDVRRLEGAEDLARAIRYGVTPAMAYEAIAMSKKRARGDGSGRTPMEIAQGAVGPAGRARDLDLILWGEYVQAMAGKRIVTMTRGLVLSNPGKAAKTETEVLVDLSKRAIRHLDDEDLLAPLHHLLAEVYHPITGTGDGETVRNFLSNHVRFEFPFVREGRVPIDVGTRAYKAQKPMTSYPPRPELAKMRWAVVQRAARSLIDRSPHIRVAGPDGELLDQATIIAIIFEWYDREADRVASILEEPVPVPVPPRPADPPKDDDLCLVIDETDR